MTPDKKSDIDAIRALIDRQFGSMSWAEGQTPDRDRFTADFLPDASLYPSARPPRAQSVVQFVERMKGLAGSALRSFEETVLGTTIRVFGNVAVAVVACENLENGTDTSRTVEMMLLVKDAGVWRVAAQAWDKESASNPISSSVWDS